MGYHNEDRELVPLKSDFDTVWYGYRRSQVRFYIQQTDAEVRMLTEDRDSALSQVSDLSAQLDQARSEIEALRAQFDEVCRSPIEEAGLSDRLRRRVRLAHDEAEEVVSSAQAAAEHEWARAEQSAAELRARYENLVAEADQWRRQSETQRNEALAETRRDIQRMAREAEAHRRKLDHDAEARRTQVERDFEISMAARRDEANRVQAEREQRSRDEAQRRVLEATAEAERRIRRANEHSDAMLLMRQDLAKRVRAAQQIMGDAEPFLSDVEAGTMSDSSDAYAAGVVHGGLLDNDPDVEVPRQRTKPAAAEASEAEEAVAEAVTG
ncbi:cellulose-binding protein [Saccharopolyspora gloriosae]|uniref:cellulose-binding protein n=1 Tax=Saccharopolyspora gloriosae TaxID=455344 RepID=UPI001FB69F51|nr:cellulose-binding protein [Saccharopolyspora gloriosae]